MLIDNVWLIGEYDKMYLVRSRLCIGVSCDERMSCFCKRIVGCTSDVPPIRRFELICGNDVQRGSLLVVASAAAIMVLIVRLLVVDRLSLFQNTFV